MAEYGGFLGDDDPLLAMVPDTAPRPWPQKQTTPKIPIHSLILKDIGFLHSEHYC
jgi:hypothetical protein